MSILYIQRTNSYITVEKLPLYQSALAQASQVPLNQQQ